LYALESKMREMMATGHRMPPGTEALLSEEGRSAGSQGGSAQMSRDISMNYQLSAASSVGGGSPARYGGGSPSRPGGGSPARPSGGSPLLLSILDLSKTNLLLVLDLFDTLSRLSGAMLHASAACLQAPADTDVTLQSARRRLAKAAEDLAAFFATTGPLAQVAPLAGQTLDGRSLSNMLPGGFPNILAETSHVQDQRPLSYGMPLSHSGQPVQMIHRWHSPPPAAAAPNGLARGYANDPYSMNFSPQFQG